MPIEALGDLNADRRIADEFVVTLARRRDAAGQLKYAVRVSCALQAGEVVIRSWSDEDITERLTSSQRSSAQSLLGAAEGKVQALLGL